MYSSQTKDADHFTVLMLRARISFVNTLPTHTYRLKSQNETQSLFVGYAVKENENSARVSFLYDILVFFISKKNLQS